MSDKLELIIADRDTDYLSLLSDYIRDTEWSRKLSARLVTRPELLQENVRSMKAHIYLLHPDFHSAAGLEGLPIRLCERKRDEEASASGLAGIYKYQPLHQLLGRTVELYRMHTGSGNKSTSDAAASVYSVFSAAGGVGKTTVSIHLARVYAEKGERCLYWNMELVPGAHFPKETDSELAAKFVYGLRSNAAWAEDCLPGLLAKAEPYGFDYFAGFHQIRETLELNVDDVKKLVACLKQSGRYDAIFFDLEATLHERVQAALMESDAIVWIITEDAESAAKSFKLLAELERQSVTQPSMRGIRFVLNKHAGNSGNVLSAPVNASPRNVPIAVKLPYVPSWKQAHGANRQLAEPIFSEGVVKLANELRLPTGGGAVAGRIDNQHTARAYS